MSSAMQNIPRQPGLIDLQIIWNRLIAVVGEQA